ncbi:MAG: EAL domain-containing protein [Proteobacteria bacterium]|nr:EAL domain-containing protein [Pseudomonadota bacterium]MBU1714735.1 EAL domain-containing protein [Pseudomonadota bacterium]
MAISLKPTSEICGIEERPVHGWRILGAFIIFFIASYLLYAFLILTGKDPGSLVVATILFGGGFFVALVVKMSLRTINSVKHLSALERHRSLHDPLTDLPNRTLLMERLDHAVIDAQNNSQSVSILIIDLDRFKEINDALGHNYGDYLLQLITPRISHAVRGSDTVSRLGGDEFAIVLPAVGAEQAVSVARKILASMEEPFYVEANKLTIDISIGIAIYPEHGIESEALLQHADIAMYTAKRNSEGYKIYNDDQEQFTLDRLTTVSRLRDALKKEHFVLFYQPKVSINDHTVQGVEALIRWRKPGDDGYVMPDDFIYLAEDSDLITPLSLWVLNQAMKQLAEWNNSGLDLKISVNLSIKNLQDIKFPEQVANLLTKWGVKAEDIILEITENSMVIKHGRTHKVIDQLHNMKFNISIDDFGTGYSSLAYLKQFPATEIKIDKSFVLNMLADENDAVIVKSTLELAHNLGLNVVAEGVANNRIKEKLIGMGCEIMQGHHICPPLPPLEMMETLHKSNWQIKKIPTLPEN